MRAVSLSNAGVRKILKDKFVCTWVNIASDPAAGSSHPHPCTDQARDMARGLGEHNTQTLILTADGRLVSALAGANIGPQDLLDELKFGESLWKQVQKVAGSQAQGSDGPAAHLKFAEGLARRSPRAGLVGREEEFFGALKPIGKRRGVADHQFSASNCARQPASSPRR